MTETPLARYDAMIKEGALEPDTAQREAAEVLTALQAELEAYRRPSGFLARFRKADPPPNGVYLWGDVGRGKSMLMDLFFETAGVAKKRRVHFHEFMQDVHDRIHAWRQREKAGKVAGDDPIPPVAEAIASEAFLLCFDEFQVSDITDASILQRLFSALLEQGVVVVATSNIAPDGLYEGGLHRKRFLPFVDLLKRRLDIVELDGEKDYRLEKLEAAPVYYTPLGPETTARMDQAFERLTGHDEAPPCTIKVKSRRLAVPQAAKGVARFGFDDLCAKPLGAADYLKLATAFHTVFIDAIPKLTPEKRNEAKRFVTLIDALYEKRVKLVASAESPPAELYPQGDGAFAFQRTASRLIEMQSHDYMALGHAV